jgi:putative transposase
MSRENSLWGAPRIHGELLKLGIEIGETSVSKYLVRSPKPPSQTWKTFLDNHVKNLVSVELLYGTNNSVSDPVRIFGAGA